MCGYREVLGVWGGGAGLGWEGSVTVGWRLGGVCGGSGRRGRPRPAAVVHTRFGTAPRTDAPADTNRSRVGVCGFCILLRAGLWLFVCMCVCVCVCVYRDALQSCVYSEGALLLPLRRGAFFRSHPACQGWSSVARCVGVRRAAMLPSDSTRGSGVLTPTLAYRAFGSCAVAAVSVALRPFILCLCPRTDGTLLVSSFWHGPCPVWRQQLCALHCCGASRSVFEVACPSVGCTCSGLCSHTDATVLFLVRVDML